MNRIAGGKYKLRSKIGSGSFGEIFLLVSVLRLIDLPGSGDMVPVEQLIFFVFLVLLEAVSAIVFLESRIFNILKTKILIFDYVS